MSALWWMLKNWRVVAGVLLLAIIGGLYWMWQSAEIDSERKAMQLETLRNAHNETLGTLDRLESDIAASREAVVQVRKREREARARARELQRVVDNAPDNGCVGPAVRGVFERLRTPNDN